MRNVCGGRTRGMAAWVEWRYLTTQQKDNECGWLLIPHEANQNSSTSELSRFLEDSTVLATFRRLIPLECLAGCGKT
jgi:hypothetical protein